MSNRKIIPPDLNINYQPQEQIYNNNSELRIINVRLSTEIGS